MESGGHTGLLLGINTNCPLALPQLLLLTHVLGLKAVHLAHQHIQAALGRQAEQTIVALPCTKD